MNDRAIVVLEQYDLEVADTRKGRGVMIADTDKGTVTLGEYAGKVERLLLCKEVCDRLETAGFSNVDNLIPNKEELLYSTDIEGKYYVVKRYVEGRECDVTNVEECQYMVRELAKLHDLMEFGENIGTDGEEIRVRDFSKRETELTRVRSFIRKQSKKGEFELAFLKEFVYFEKVAREASEILDEDCLTALSSLVKERGMYCHGECNQHNILMYNKKGIAATHFEKCCMDIQVRDLYLFLRKILEKNNWSYEMGYSILDAYMQQKELGKDEKKYLYARLLYPERFWKIANAYVNKRKSLPPRRQLEKLNALVAIEDARIKFLGQLSKELL